MYLHFINTALQCGTPRINFINLLLPKLRLEATPGIYVPIMHKMDAGKGSLNFIENIAIYFYYEIKVAGYLLLLLYTAEKK